MKEALLQQNFSLLERDFFLNPFTRKELSDLFVNHNLSDFLSINSPSFKKLQIQATSLCRENVIDLMLDEPRLIRRPLLKIENKLFIGDIKLSFLADL
ncbi:MAG: hypothetical protein MK345_07205 [SAR202 cluster bacterium]|nr:hypothetical protein [SAR202 cluster bacterium]